LQVIALARTGSLDMTFRTVFEATPAEDLLIWFPVIGLAFVFVGVLLVLKPQIYADFVFPGVRGGWRRLLGWTWLIGASFWTAAVFPTASQRQSVSQSEPSTVVEGPVTNFARMPYNGPSNGSFVVGGKQFAFSEFWAKPVPASIAEGVYARVTFRERPVNRIEILRVEVADPN
jgi:hypothetical protein